MYKKFINIALIVSLFTSFAVPVNASTLENCKKELMVTMETVMGLPKRAGLQGYLKQLKAMTSSNIDVSKVITEVEQLARDARIEMRGICTALDKFGGTMNTEFEIYTAAYELDQCFEFKKVEPDKQRQIQAIVYCKERADLMLDEYLDGLRQVLLEQAIRTSMDPLVQRFRSLNGRLVVLLGDYSRLVKNFYTFSFRLGDTITGEWD